MSIRLKCCCGDTGFFAKLTGETDGVYTATKVILNSSGEFAEADPQQTISGLKEANGQTGLYDSETDTYVWVYSLRESDGTAAYRFVYGGNSIEKNIGFGVPAAGETDSDFTNPYIQLTVTTSSGTPILDESQQEQTIKVWRNATRRQLYTDFDANTVFTYVRFPQPEGDVGGCIFSRTEAFSAYGDWLPADGYSLHGETDNPPNSTDITGSPSDEGHYHVTGKMYVSDDGAGGRAWAPWFAIDPDQLATKVYTDGSDTTSGNLNDEIIVTPATGHNWITKSVTPGGVNDNKLLLEHDEWNDSRISSTTKVVDIESVGGGVTLTSSVPPLFNRSYIKYEGLNLSRDPAGHIKITGTTDYYAYWMELPEPTALGDMIYASMGVDLEWSVLNKGESQSLLYINEYKPDWLAKGNNESILTTQGGSLKWLDKAPDDSLFTTTGGSLTWYAKGDDESILLTRSGSFHWLPSGMDQSLMYVNGTQVDWFGNPSYDAVLINSATSGGLSWFPKGDDESIYITRNGEFNWLSPGGDQALLHIDGGALAWFDSSLLPAVLTSDASGLSWATAGGDESIFISRSGSFDWLDKGGVGSLLHVSAGDTLAWLGAGGEQSLLHIDSGVPTWLGAGGNQSLLYINGVSLAWFAANGGNALLTTSGGDLSWKSSGADQSIFISTGSGFNWFSRGGDGSLLSVDGGALSWLGAGGDQALLHINGTTPAWFEAGMSQSMLIIGSTGDLSWKPKGADESIYVTRNGELDWMGKGDIGSMFYIDTSDTLSWLPKGEEQSLLHIDDNVPTWKSKGADESMLITRDGNLSWLDKAEEGSIFAIINGELTWLAPPTGDGKYFLTYSGGSLAWEEGQEWSCS